MYIESNWSHKKGEKKKRRLGDWTKAFKHTVHPPFSRLTDWLSLINDHSNCQASCSVCSAPAAIHLHYGAISCYSCRLHLLNFSKFSSGYFVQGLFPKRGSQTSQVGCYSTSVWFLSYHRMWAMCLRCIFGTGGCKITQQNRTNCKLCRYQVSYNIRKGNVTEKMLQCKLWTFEMFLW